MIDDADFTRCARPHAKIWSADDGVMIDFDVDYRDIAMMSADDKVVAMQAARRYHCRQPDDFGDAEAPHTLIYAI